MMDGIDDDNDDDWWVTFFSLLLTYYFVIAITILINSELLSEINPHSIVIVIATIIWPLSGLPMPALEHPR